MKIKEENNKEIEVEIKENSVGIKENKDNLIESNEILLSEAERGAINYIKKQESYLIASGVFPIYFLAVNIVNIRFIWLLFVTNRIWIQRSVDLILPILIFFVIFIFSLSQFILLKNWRNKVKDYEKQKILLKTYSNGIDKIPNMGKLSLTNMFYDIINHMDRIKKLFIIMNLFCVFYLIWAIDFFIIGIPISISQRIVEIVWILNYIAFIVVVIYLLFEWFHFVKWIKKHNHLKKFEKKIYEELKL